jgi:hypothetical protein
MLRRLSVTVSFLVVMAVAAGFVAIGGRFGEAVQAA